ncbi:hypothetical protein N7650_26200 [Pseudomonas sp. GD04058]|nr:hypothetical protein [Pseudomonas sp. GD04058]MDG9886321.1 hypothetical protein [Pseudomonas sp. GD04058]
MKISLAGLGDRARREINWIAEQFPMTTIIQDRFDSGAQVSLEMDKNEGELFVFHCPAGQGCKVSKWPLDSYHMPIAMAHYEQCLELERAAFEACSASA